MANPCGDGGEMRVRVGRVGEAGGACALRGRCLEHWSAVRGGGSRVCAPRGSTAHLEYNHIGDPSDDCEVQGNAGRGTLVDLLGRH